MATAHTTTTAGQLLQAPGLGRCELIRGTIQMMSPAGFRHGRIVSTINRLLATFVVEHQFHFYSDERREPAHIHVRTPDGECKFWLDPVLLASNRGLRPNTLRDIERLVFVHLEFLREKYDEFHNP